ncbi:XRE family transcriptional regulator [Methylobacterium sp. 275MFSha3.1]|uniref:helix-turn-helix domain-containing protein n=1 Tax=Methylobacterium sp. 275MFSha3.1 TaxID=1502746 RepID=UPI000B80DE90
MNVRTSTWKAYDSVRHSCAMVTTSARPVAERLAHLRERAGMSLEQVAREAGYRGRSSIQRYFEDQTIESLQPKVAAKLARALVGKGTPPIQPAELIVLVHGDADHGAWMAQLEIMPLAASTILKLPPHEPRDAASSVLLIRSGMLPVMGPAHASNWMERSPSLDEPEDWISVPNEHYVNKVGQYVLRIVGPSLNKVAPDGHYAICQRYGEGRHTPPNGKYVHVERWRGDFIEWTIRKVRSDGDQVLLCPDSTHPDHQQVLDLGASEDQVRILGIVTGWYRPA